MATISMLWLPILLAAAFVFVASSLVHMVLPIHAGDYRKLPNEDLVRQALRDAEVKPGQYMYPGCDSMKEYASEELQKKFAEGPVGVMIVRPDGMPNMGKSLLQWFLVCLLVSLITAHLATFACEAGAAAGRVFHVTALVALMGYCGGCALAIGNELQSVAQSFQNSLGGGAVDEQGTGRPFLGMFTYGEQCRMADGRNQHVNLMYAVLAFCED